MIISLLLTSALAAEPISSGATVLVGVGSTFDDDPATMKIEVQGEVPIYPDEAVGLGLVLPVEFTTTGEESFGISTNVSMFTLIPQLRVRAANVSPVRVYADAGLGLAYVTAQRDTWFIDSETTRTGWGSRFDIGIEAGPPEGGVAFVFEPIGIDTLHFEGGHDSVGYTGRLGVGVRY